MNILTEKHGIVNGDRFYRLDCNGNRFIAVVVNVTALFVDVEKFSPYLADDDTVVERAQLCERYEGRETGRKIRGLFGEYSEVEQVGTGEVYIMLRDGKSRFDKKYILWRE